MKLLALGLALSPEELKTRVEKLKDAVTGLQHDVKEIKAEVGLNVGKCECIAVPEEIERKDGKVTASNGVEYADSYGGSCAQHDLETDACSGEYKPAYCYEAWCYVSPDCEESDTKDSFFFGKKTELHYSYKNCGGLDAFAAEACSAGKDEGNCTEISDSCAWNKGTELCQNKLCQCTGDNNGQRPEGAEDSYGETCAPWDHQSCEGWEDTDGVNLGLWCCKSWCYVPEECPSAKASAVDGAKDLFYSYYACPDDADALGQCKWDEPINFDGSPVALSSDAASKLNEAAKQQGFLRKMRKYHRARVVRHE